MFVPKHVADRSPEEAPQLQWFNFDGDVYEATVQADVVVGFTAPYGNSDGQRTNKTYAPGAVVEIEDMWWGPDYVSGLIKVLPQHPALCTQDIWIPLWLKSASNPTTTFLVFCTIAHTGWKF